MAAILLSLIVSVYVGGGYYVLKPHVAEKPRVVTNCTLPSERLFTIKPPREPL